MACFVLVHGGYMASKTWNELTESNDYPEEELLGGACWRLTAALLEKAGHRVFAPDLLEEYSHSLSDHVDQVSRLIEEEDLDDIVLVGHSYGGMVITGVGAILPERIGRLVYLDANFPDPGQSLFDILELAGFDPRAVIEGVPLAYTERIRFDPTGLDPLKKIYIRCAMSDFLTVTEVMIQKIDFDSDDWTYHELPTGHFAQVTMPDDLVGIVTDRKGGSI